MQILWNNFLGLGEVFASLLLLIDSVIYWLLSELFGLYVTLAKAKIFNSAMYADIANKVYLIVGVVALFIVVYALLQSIINPDNLKKSGLDFVKKLAIGIVMITLTPAIFNLLYKIQDVVLSDSIIPNIILGDSNKVVSDKPLQYMEVDSGAAFIDPDTGEITGYDNSQINYDQAVAEGRIKYFIQDTKECKSLDYEEAIKKDECLVYSKDNSDSLLNEYGNYMGYIVLSSFLHPANGFDENTVIVNASKRFDTANGVNWSIIGCVAGAVLVVVGVATGGFTGGLSWAGVASVSSWMVTAGCVGGVAIGSGANKIAALIDYSEYTWFMAKLEMIGSGEFDRITAFAPAIVAGEMSYTPIVSTICGIIILWMLLSYCIDLGIRAAKLAFYQLFAPISFLLNAVPGQKDLLGNWVKAVLTTWGEVFIRIFTMVAAVYLISSLDMVELEGFGLVAKAIIVIGIIAFVKQFPKLLGDLTGIKSENMKLGIMDKLGAGGVLAAGALIGGGITAGVKNITNSWRNSGGQNIGKRLLSAAGSGIGGFASGGFRSARGAGFKAKSFGDMRKAASSGAKAAHSKSQGRAAYKASHPGLGGVAMGHVADAWTGVKNWAGVHGNIMDTVQYEDDYIASFDDYSSLYENAEYKIFEEQLRRKRADVVANGGNPDVDPEVGRLELDLQRRRLEAINKNTNAAAYAAYNIANQVKRNPNMASSVGISDEFIKNANDFVLKNNTVYHKDGTTPWSEAELHRLFEGVENTIDSSTGKYKKSSMYGTFEGLSKSKGAVRAQRSKDKNSIEFKEAKKAADKSN